MCQVSPEERENLCKTWALRTHESMRAQIVLQETEEWIENHGHRDPDCNVMKSCDQSRDGSNQIGTI